jgi:hypothetical protein
MTEEKVHGQREGCARVGLRPQRFGGGGRINGRASWQQRGQTWADMGIVVVIAWETVAVMRRPCVRA